MTKMKKEYIKPSIIGIYEAEVDMAAPNSWGQEDENEEYTPEGNIIGPGFGGEDDEDDWGESV